MFLIFLFAQITRWYGHQAPPLCQNQDEFIISYGHLFSPSYEKVFLQKSLGSGHYGDVYACTINNFKSVVKLIDCRSKKRPTEISERIVRTVKNEEKISSILKNFDGVVVPFFCVVHQYHVAYIMKRKYQSLSKLRTVFFKLSFTRQLKLFIRIGETLERMKKLHIIHNDLKPGNIIAEDEKISDVFIIDFGGACIEGETCHGGTRGYSPQEKLNNGLRILGKYSLDIWSYIVTIISLYSGSSGNDILDLLSDNKHACWKKMTIICHNSLNKSFKYKLKNAPSWFTRSIMSALHYTPEKRPSISRILKKLRIGFKKSFFW